MKIIVLSSHTPSLFWFRMDMMSEFVSRGHSVVAVGNECESRWGTQFAKEHIKYRQAYIQRNGTNPIHDIKTLKSLKSILLEEKPDKVFAYQAKTVIYGCIAANQLGMHDIYPLIAGVGSVFLSNGFKTRVIRAILRAEYKYALRKCKSVFFQNSDDVKVFKENNIIDLQRVVLLNGSGVNLDTFVPQALPSKTAFLCIGRLIRDKGIYEYLEACRNVKRKYPDIRCLLVGPYDTNPSALRPDELEPYIEDGSVEYFGEQTDVRPYFNQCSVYILPSYREGTPKTVLEAMASCKAIITTDAPGCKETVIDGKNGFLVPVRDVGALEQKMCLLIENPGMVAEMAKASRKVAEERFDVRKVNQTINSTMGV